MEERRGGVGSMLKDKKRATHGESSARCVLKERANRAIRYAWLAGGSEKEPMRNLKK